MSNYIYDVTLSFADEDREIVDDVAHILKSYNVKVFYDKFEQANLWGKNLYDYLADIYSNHARYCVMFISQNYPLKAWANLERQHAQERGFRDHKEYILPVQLDDTNIPGLTKTVGYFKVPPTTAQGLADAIKQKLQQDRSDSQTQKSPLPLLKLFINHPEIKPFLARDTSKVEKTFSDSKILTIQPDDKVSPFLRTLQEYPISPRVNIIKIPTNIYDEFRELFSSYDDARNKVVKSIQEYLATLTKEEQNKSTTQRVTNNMMGIPKQENLVIYWSKVFREACIEGPRLVASLLLIDVDGDKFQNKDIYYHLIKDLRDIKHT